MVYIVSPKLNNVSVNFNSALLRELCMTYYLTRDLASTAEFDIFGTFLFKEIPHLALV